MQFEVGEPFPMGGGKRYMCLAKVVGRRYRVRHIAELSAGQGDESERTQTLCVVSEEGTTPDEARARLLARLGAARLSSPAPPRRGWLARLITVFK
jgi:hypothetical protein